MNIDFSMNIPPEELVRRLFLHQSLRVQTSVTLQAAEDTVFWSYFDLTFVLQHQYLPCQAVRVLFV